MDVETLVARCRRGDGLAWETLVRRYQARLFSVAWHYLRDAEEARDMAQEIFIRIYRRLDDYDGQDRFLPWMLKLARNACIDRLRRIKARPPATDVPIRDGVEIPSGDLSPEERSDTDSRRRLLYRALAQMNEKSREIILLKDIQGLRLEEIASMLGLPLGTVKSRSSRARIELATRVRSLDASYGEGHP